mmetsp:Transcript_64805/g.180083  ORF Transcript_64805/g.180083 Transcript_64805/m.180083 type:complete len:99 (-) Transcript_64805:328-624(-)
MASSLPTMEKAIAAAVVDNETFEAAVRAVDVLDSSSRFGGATTSLASDEAEGGHQENPLNSRAMVLESLPDLEEEEEGPELERFLVPATIATSSSSVT